MTSLFSTFRLDGKLPLWLKLGFSAYLAVLVPVYWFQYGPTNFIYFCDLALFLTLWALWSEKALPASMAAVGIVLVQMVWCVDFVAQFVGLRITGTTDYMFDPAKPLFLRLLSLFHGWLPFLLVFLVRRLGYDKRAFWSWTLLAWAAMLIAYFFLPAPGAVPANPKAPVNINYVYGLSDAVAQTWMPKVAWLAVMLSGLPLLVYLPSHLALKRFARPVPA